MTNICLINGSLRGKESSSLAFLCGLKTRLETAGFGTAAISVKADAKSHAEGELRTSAGADALIVAFPLHAYCLPGALMRLLEEYGRHAGSIGLRPIRQKMYAIVNCGYHGAEINGEAIRVLRNFCRRTGLDWRFAVAIGGGVVVKMTRKVPIMNWKLVNAYSRIAKDIASGGEGNQRDILIKPIIPKFVMMKMKDSEWAKKYMSRKEK